MRGRIKGLWPLLWQMVYPLLVYVAVVELVFAAWGILAGQATESQALPLTALGAALAMFPLGSDYRMVRRRNGPCGNAAPSGRRKGQMGGRSVLLVFFFAVGACLLFNSLLWFLPCWEGGYQKVGRTLQGPSFGVQLACIGIVIPAAEELIFRGLGYYRLRQEMTVKASAALTAGCFALFHGNLLQGVYAALLGLFLAMLYEVYDSLWACWLFHGAANLASLTLSRFLTAKGPGLWQMAGGIAFGGALFFTMGNKIIREGKERETINHNHTLL